MKNMRKLILFILPLVLLAGFAYGIDTNKIVLLQQQKTCDRNFACKSCPIPIIPGTCVMCCAGSISQETDERCWTCFDKHCGIDLDFFRCKKYFHNHHPDCWDNENQMPLTDSPCGSFYLEVLEDKDIALSKCQ